MTLFTNKRRPIIIGPDTPIDAKETDVWVDSTTNIIKRYNGSVWVDIIEAGVYLISASAAAAASAHAVAYLTDSAPGVLDTLNELAAALGDDENFATSVYNSISSASANNNAYTDYRVDSASGALTGYINAEIGYLQTSFNNNIDLSEVELVGIINTASVANTNYTDSEIIALNLTAGLVSASAAAVTYANALTTTDVAEGTGLYFTNQRAIDSGSATYLTQSDATTTYLPKTGGTVTGNLAVNGTLTVSGSTAYVNVTEFKVDDPMIYLAGNSSANIVDIGIVGNYNDGSYHHTGLVKDATDGRWKFFSSVETEPSATIAFEEGILDAVAMGSASVVGNVNASAFIGDGSQLTGIPISTKADKLNSFSQQTASYTLVLSDADKVVEISNASANNLTVPPNSSVAFPVGAELTVLQTSTGQTTITPGSGVTINGTPGLKLRAQWASAVLIQRSANSWVAIGDLSA